ncbi:Glycosylphosphatidylinositol anchor biosynthesis protein 11 [Wickerhamomyces ciferrii]|uniref:Glycosylphosphatidylinositol anchor biosynthesis protein 11 n=1 Tax=Wickerhamomyces ciferrii (strain ATCC 14091 / BCRC 22168 / CBS 111 / JCM 3599 / NBRC 0793 / NRRL Y-1031 F-60-10) TaxID=1206466 RepID=K0KXP1_WICCF|nr:Glycosylphosphatidylinositol anchor biosynthesis protein 11 [Wickerhamomyces ciferrii]CCH45823.1 Glycosylphosphatidylinositol anchor biosynthesis protein 11 [Wickerhamomyces ciferrii]
MPTRTTPKKTVSFSDNEPPVKEQQHIDLEENIKIPFSLKTIPFHYILIVYSILKQDITTGNVLNNLINNLFALIFMQLVYTFLFVTNIIEITKKKHQKRVKLSIGKDYSLIISSILISLVFVLPIYLLVVLFGAPFTTYFQENLILSTHLSFLSYPIIVSYFKTGEKSIYYKYLAFIAIGAWFGAIAIPLDWDRDWQNWPLPIVISSYIGSFIGYSIVGLL